MLYKPIKVQVDNKPYFVLAFCPYDLTGFDFWCFRFWFTYASTHLRQRNWRGRTTLVCCLVPSPAGAHPIMQYGGSVRQKYWWHSQDMDWLLPSSDTFMVRFEICYTRLYNLFYIHVFDFVLFWMQYKNIHKHLYFFLLLVCLLTVWGHMQSS